MGLTTITMFINTIILLFVINNYVLCNNIRHQHHYLAKYKNSHQKSSSHVDITTKSPTQEQQHVYSLPHLDRLIKRLNDHDYRHSKKQFIKHSNRKNWNEEQDVLIKNRAFLKDDWKFESDDYKDNDYDEETTEQSNQGNGVNSQQDDSGHKSNPIFSIRRNKIKTPSSASDYDRDFQAALNHATKMLLQTKCRTPKERVVCTSDVYPNPSKIYVPKCTVLHRCMSDVGCCPNENMQCGTKRSHPVVLPFYVTTVIKKTADGSQNNTNRAIERLTFYNDTECECQYQHYGQAMDYPPVHSRAYYLTYPEHGKPDAIQPEELRSSPTNQDGNKGCRCPSEYTSRNFANGTCVCDCIDGHRECLRFKKGRQNFSLLDRQCITKGDCREPKCEHGAYLPKPGRCPTRYEYNETHHNTRHNEHHRNKSKLSPIKNVWTTSTEKPITHSFLTMERQNLNVLPWLAGNNREKSTESAETKPVPETNSNNNHGSGSGKVELPVWPTLPPRREFKLPDWLSERKSPSLDNTKASLDWFKQPISASSSVHIPWNPSDKSRLTIKTSRPVVHHHELNPQ